ncbi:hypothetical protein PSPO01_11701 [Paraphaeosphaeria sporulosa]
MWVCGTSTSGYAKRRRHMYFPRLQLPDITAAEQACYWGRPYMVGCWPLLCARYHGRRAYIPTPGTSSISVMYP